MAAMDFHLNKRFKGTHPSSLYGLGNFPKKEISIVLLNGIIYRKEDYTK